MTASERSQQKYRLQFIPEALEEWYKLDGSIRSILKTQLAKRLENPVVPSASLRGSLSNCYKIKLRQQGVRLVYQVLDADLIVLVLAIGKRDRNAVYLSATKRLDN